ncbi:MAG: dephospho-CoA kinase [Candidatus Omnitrophica bacterium]|nr:dephospho-CoA kinase [Candidatus Omnitrophota bacterium]
MQIKNRIVIGVTGSIGSGKSTAASIFKKLGAKVLDADRLTKDIYRMRPAVVKKIAETFGKDVLTAKGHLDRKKLSLRAFCDKNALRALNRIVHPHIIKRLKQEIGKKYGLIIVDAALLIESGFNRFVDYVLLINCPLRLRLKRALGKHKLSEAEFRMRLNHQLPFIDKKRHAHFVINNSGSLNQLKGQIKKIYKEVAR